MTDFLTNMCIYNMTHSATLPYLVPQPIAAENYNQNKPHPKKLTSQSTLIMHTPRNGLAPDVVKTRQNAREIAIQPRHNRHVCKLHCILQTTSG
ncbi:hypothetical protein [Natronohydrobacter thiooxidans]|uniref:hypothetical protein n=1 Tax=Natronohydrobacter thiooxidans TaxID=87172 RepID=UPI001587C188|nr:hypothetical protein [Natronohydrobacter thiooxidans]